MDEWLVIYRTYSPQKLTDELNWLTEESRNIYSSQTIGQKANTRSTAEIKTRLLAAIRVSEERAGRPTIRDSVPDFSCGASSQGGQGRVGWNV